MLQHTFKIESFSSLFILFYSKISSLSIISDAFTQILAAIRIIYFEKQLAIKLKYHNLYFDRYHFFLLKLRSLKDLYIYMLP